MEKKEIKKCYLLNIRFTNPQDAPITFMCDSVQEVHDSLDEVANEYSRDFSFNVVTVNRK